MGTLIAKNNVKTVATLVLFNHRKSSKLFSIDEMSTVCYNMVKHLSGNVFHKGQQASFKITTMPTYQTAKNAQVRL